MGEKKGRKYGLRWTKSKNHPGGCQTYRFSVSTWHLPNESFQSTGVQNPSLCESMLDNPECVVNLGNTYSRVSGPFNSIAVNRLRGGHAAVHCGRGQRLPAGARRRKPQTPASESPSNPSKCPLQGHNLPFTVNQNEQTVTLKTSPGPRWRRPCPGGWGGEGTLANRHLDNCHAPVNVPLDEKQYIQSAKPQTPSQLCLYSLLCSLFIFLFFSSSFFSLYPI